MHYSILQMILVFSLMTIIFGRALYYDELNEDDINTQSFSKEDKDGQDLKAELLDVLNDYDDTDNDNVSFDSYEEKKFHQRSLFDASRASHTISAHTRQAIIDILQKAMDEGFVWRTHLKHHNPGTRFGRH